MTNIIIALALIGSIIVSCRPSKKNNEPDSPKTEVLGATGSSEAQSSVRPATITPTGRAVDLFAIRASVGGGFVPPDIDKLPCPYFRQGPAFQIPAIQGGPPIPLPGPIQNYYSGSWNGIDQYRLKVSAYNRLYRDKGIPDWILTMPQSRAVDYVPKLFDVTILRPTKSDCAISASLLN
jgi:hypothetical protein